MHGDDFSRRYETVIYGDCSFVLLEHQGGSAIADIPLPPLKVSRYATLVHMAISFSFVVHIFPRKCNDV